MSNKNKNKNDIPEKIDRAVDESDSVFDIIFNLDDGTYTTMSHEETAGAAEAFAEEAVNEATDAVEETREQIEEKAVELAEKAREAEEAAGKEVEKAEEAVSEAAEDVNDAVAEGAAVAAGIAAAAEIPDENDFAALEGFEDDIEGEDILSEAGEELKERLDEGEKLAEEAAEEAEKSVEAAKDATEAAAGTVAEAIDEGAKSAEEQAEKINKEAEEEIREAGAEAFKVRDEADEKIASLNGRMREIASEANDKPQKSTVKGLALGGMLVISEDEQNVGEDDAADEFREMSENVTESDDSVRAEKIKDLAENGDGKKDNVATKLRGILGLSGTEGGGKTLLGMNYAMWSMIILLVFVFDAVLMNFVLHKVIYPIVSNVMTASGAASLKLDSYETLYTGISYGIAFLIGGLVLFLIAKIAQMLMEEVETSNPGNLIKIVLFGLMIIFGIGGLIAMLVTHKGLFSLAAYRWICPFMGYAGGLLFFLFSEIGKKKK
ncbi:MAG: hypothetical protein J6X87_01425 [Clostridia bacterium]|nr:hypothetical protein [Clostridia bacterium]